MNGFQAGDQGNTGLKHGSQLVGKKTNILRLDFFTEFCTAFTAPAFDFLDGKNHVSLAFQHGKHLFLSRSLPGFGPGNSVFPQYFVFKCWHY